jgi:hypothetical protein
VESSGVGSSAHKLIAYQRYFGLEARAFHSGASRMLARVSVPALHPARVNVRSLSEDFRLDVAASGTLLRAFLAGGLLYPDGNGGYEVSERFREYALAPVIVPLTRSQARGIIGVACRLAAAINEESDRNPFMIETIAVSGAYMSRRDLLSELQLWLVLRVRSQPQGQRSEHLLSKEDAWREIKARMKGLDAMMVVRIVSDKQKVERPFSVVFQATDEVIKPQPGAWEKLRDWGASLGQRTASKRDSHKLAAVAPMELVTQQRGPRTLQRARSTWGTVGKRG